TNEGTQPGTGIEVKDYLSSAYTYVSDNGGAATTFANDTVVWTVGTLAAGASLTLQITVTINGSGDLNNFAEVTAADFIDVDSSPDNDNDNTANEDDEATAAVGIVN